jgi:hypothetical protein
MSRRLTPKISQGRHTIGNHKGDTTGNIIANTQETRSAEIGRSTPKIHTVH